jgi:hypothetical protein
MNRVQVLLTDGQRTVEQGLVVHQPATIKDVDES